MNVEELVRDSLREQAAGITPPPPGLAGRILAERRRRRARTLAAAAATTALVVAAAVGVPASTRTEGAPSRRPAPYACGPT
ncbi:hypothetical protein AB0O63_10615 [Streptomyces cyaneofuscatus]|uniref:hypothetical protein n=1 Tax=Streptomyces cyaneofuscatus TaxID=66883 RepID=UPI00342ABD2B